MFPDTARRSLTASAVAASLIGLLGSAAPASAAHASKRSASCGSSTIVNLGSGPEPEPKELATPLPASVLGSFAVFRRAALSGDQLPALSSAGSELDGQLASYYSGSVRQLLTLSDGSRFFVIPGLEQAENVPPARCLPKSLRSLRPKLVEQQRKHSAEPVNCIVRVGGPRHVGGSACEPFAETDKSPRVFLSAFTGGPTVDLVPDGVASVRIDYRTVAPIVAGVSENAFVFTAPKALIRRLGETLRSVIGAALSTHHGKARQLTKAQKRHTQRVEEKALEKALLQAEPTRVEWLDGSGALVRSISPPPSPFDNSHAPIDG
jgi:hypothetical protein